MRDALVRIGRFAEPPLEPIVPAASQFGYRNKLEYSFTTSEDGVDLGFHRAGRWDEVIGIEECLLTTDLGNAIRLAVRGWAREEGSRRTTSRRATGYLRHLVVREGRNTGQALVVLVTAPGERFEAGYLVDVLRRFPEVRSVHWAINDTPAEQTNLPTKLLWGVDAIEEEILGLRFRVRPSAFLQTNTEMAARLYELAREYARLTGVENVFDLYCGTGTIGLALAGERAVRLGSRDLRGGGGVRDRERRAQRDRERTLLRRQRRSDDRGASRGGRRRRTSSSSILRVPGSPGRRCVGRARSARRGSSTSRATRRRSRPISRCYATSTDTSSSAAGPSTCFRTRRTSSRCRRSACLGRTPARARRTSRQSRSAFGRRNPRQTAGSAGRPGHVVPVPDERERRAEARRHPDPRRGRRGAGSGRRLRGRARRRGCRAGRCSRRRSRPGSETRSRPARRVPARSSTTYSVGPAATDQMSTHGTRTATSVSHHSSSKSERNVKPASA